MSEFRSGFVSFVGRPNVGKSTLTNALVGEKIAITSSKPQTTRRAIRGIVNTPDAQIILVDTPGLHRPRTLLGQRLNNLVENTLGQVDVIGFVFEIFQSIGRISFINVLKLYGQVDRPFYTGRANYGSQCCHKVSVPATGF